MALRTSWEFKVGETRWTLNERIIEWHDVHPETLAWSKWVSIKSLVDRIEVHTSWESEKIENILRADATSMEWDWLEMT